MPNVMKFKSALSISSLLHLNQSQHVQSHYFSREFYIKFILQFLSGIVLHCITLLDPIYLHNSNATLKDINIVTVFKHTF